MYILFQLDTNAFLDFFNDVLLLKKELKEFLNNSSLIDADFFYTVSTYKQKLSMIDGNLEVCNAYFATLVEELEIEEYYKNVFANRILVSKSIENTLNLFELVKNGN